MLYPQTLILDRHFPPSYRPIELALLSLTTIPLDAELSQVGHVPVLKQPLHRTVDEITAMPLKPRIAQVLLIEMKV